MTSPDALPNQDLGAAVVPGIGEGELARAERLEVDRSLLRGVAWTGVVRAVSQGVAWISTLVVARILSPSDYGVVGMATLYLGLLQMISEFGIGSAIVTRRELTPDQVAQLNMISVLMGVAGALLVAATSPLLGIFFHNDQLPAVLAVLGLTFFISSFRSVPWGLLQRDLRFKRLAAYDGVQAILLALVAVVLAWAGFRYWTLVIAAVASALISALIAVTQHPVAFRWPRFRQLRRTLSFSGNIVAQRVLWYSYSNSDFLVAGRMLGSGPLGIYTLAWTLSHITDKVTGMVLQVSPAVLARVQTEPDELRRYVTRITEGLALTVMPLMIGITLVAPEFVHVALGDKWATMILPLQLLSAYATVNVVLPLFAQVLNATGHESFGVRNNIIQLAIMLPAFVVGGHFGGVTGIALAWVIAHPFIGWRLAHYTIRTIALPAGAFFREALWPAVRGCLAMAVVVEAARFGMPPAINGVFRLAAEIIIGGVAYAGAVMIFGGEAMRGKRNSLRELFGK